MIIDNESIAILEASGWNWAQEFAGWCCDWNEQQAAELRERELQAWREELETHGEPVG